MTHSPLTRWPQAPADSDPRRRPVLVFSHLPKAGGSTLSQIIRHKVGGRSYCFYEVLFAWLNLEKEKRFLRRFLTLPPRERDRFDTLIGHMPTGIHRILARPCAYITLLRDPLERLISQYYHAALREWNYSYAAIASGELSLEKYLKEKSRNYMTKRILGFDLFDEAWDWRRLDEIKASGMEMRDAIDRAWRKPVTPAMLEQAKTKLREQFMLVGVTERFNDFVFLLARELGWAPAPHYRLKNISPLRPRALRPAPEVIAQFREHNRMDIALYAYAKQLFERRWAELGAVEKSCARSYRFKQFCYQKLHAQKVPEKGPPCVRLRRRPTR